MDALKQELFEQPVYLLIALAVAAVALLIAWRELRRRVLLWLVIVPIAMGVGVWLVSGWVVTDREEIRAACQEIVDDLNAGKRDALETYLDEDVIVDLGSYGPRVKGRQLVLGTARMLLNRWTDLDIRITDFDAEIDKWAKVTLVTRVSVTVEGFGSQSTTLAWPMRWLKGDDGWRIVEVEPPQRQGL